MKRLIALTLGVLILCAVSSFVGYQYGYNWGLRVQQRNALNVPGLVDVYGCGVDRFIKVDTNHGVALHELLASLNPLPSTVNGVFFNTNRFVGPQIFVTLSEAQATNGIGRWPLTGGESILLVHQFK